MKTVIHKGEIVIIASEAETNQLLMLLIKFMGIDETAIIIEKTKQTGFNKIIAPFSLGTVTFFHVLQNNT